MIGKTATVLAAVLFALILLVGIADGLYPDVLSCYAGQRVEDKAVFCVVTDGEEASGEITTGQVRLWGALPLKNVQIRYYEKNTLIPGGMAFGVKLQAKGLLITGTEGFLSQGQSVAPAAECGLKEGDRILRAEGVGLEKTEQLVRLVEKSRGKAVTLTVLREGKEQEIVLQPRQSDGDKKYRAGLLVKDSTAGIGTVTFIDPATLCFGGLGHGITDAATGAVTPMESGEVWQVSIDGIEKGAVGDPGELKGSFSAKKAGALTANTPTGVYGTLNELPSNAGEALPIALKNELQTGKATIRCTLSSEGVKEYEVEIERIVSADAQTKNFVVRVTDPELLSLTGGIVQGMSGSPIIQNEKLVGAVTHVLVNDPTRGYGIFIENMLEAAQVQPKAA